MTYLARGTKKKIWEAFENRKLGTTSDRPVLLYQYTKEKRAFILLYFSALSFGVFHILSIPLVVVLLNFD